MSVNLSLGKEEKNDVNMPHNGNLMDTYWYFFCNN